MSYWYGGVSFIKNGTVTEYGKEDGLPSSQVFAFARDRKGAVWIAAGKMGSLDSRVHVGERSDLIGLRRASQLPFSWITPAQFGSERRPVSLYLGGGSKPVSDSCTGPDAVYNFAESSDGTLWMAETGYGVRPVPLPGKTTDGLSPAIFVGSQAITFDNQGSLWITSLGVESVEFRIRSICINRRLRARLHGSSTIPRSRRSPKGWSDKRLHI